MFLSGWDKARLANRCALGGLGQDGIGIKNKVVVHVLTLSPKDDVLMTAVLDQIQSVKMEW